MDKRSQLDAAILELDGVNDKLINLASRTNAYTYFTVQYAKTFQKHKTAYKDVKISDETGKQLVYADPEFFPVLEEYNLVKYESDIYSMLSKNLQAKIFALKSSIADENRTENSQ